ncbi:transmembrane protein, putative (macronuclear) [Tetrahymena thermophila SB210]|uniref:Transmembrane protein, putative n=1 Tax=Tetrahymena thermophila (strain SB210) TaxID=312017 RepID=I7MML4_TETTS|nr:transmembrane protein, putative [Tetrahymena thermophila SB210]EAS05135.2 transmembrane protein, putative [Tetrahymena thermophila SB210]|eukprot:XP_001025380.2 transmembrane protein, putative [Tetrahymena thermophila SB210]
MKRLEQNKYKLIFFVLLLQNIIITRQQSSACGPYCSQCNFDSCTQCQVNFQLDLQSNSCISSCSTFNQYYYIDQNECLPMCPYGYQESVASYTCSKNVKCPQFSNLGNQFNSIIDTTIVNSSTQVISQKSSDQSQFYFSLFNSTSFLIIGNILSFNQQFQKTFFDSILNQLIISSVSQISFWDINNWKQVNSIDLASHLSNSQYISYLDNQIAIIQDTTYINFVIVDLSKKNTDLQFSDLNLQRKVDIVRVFNNTVTYQIPGKNGFQIIDFQFSSNQLQQYSICSSYLPQSIPLGIQYNNQNRIFFAYSQGNIGTWDSVKGCRLIKIDPTIQAFQLVFANIDQAKQNVNLISLNQNSVAFISISLTQDNSLQSIIYSLQSNPVSVQTFQQTIYVLEQSGLQSALNIQQSQLALSCSQLIPKHNFQKFIKTMVLSNIFYIVYKDSIVSYKFNNDNGSNQCTLKFQNQLSQFKPQQSQSGVQINGVIIDNNYLDQILTYGQDGSIRIYQKLLINQRYQLQLFKVYYHPSCNINANGGNAAYQCQQILNASYNQNQEQIINLGNKFLKWISLAIYYPQTHKLAFTFAIGIVIITFNGNSPSSLYVDASLVSDFCYHYQAQQIFLQQLEYKKALVYNENDSAYALEQVLFAGNIQGLTCGMSSTNYFYYFILVPLVPSLKNTVYVFQMPNMEVVFQQSYQDQVTGVYLSESELILYISFSNGNIEAGKIFLDYFINTPSIQNLNALYYSSSKYYIASSGINSNQAQLSKLSSLNLQVQKQVTIQSVSNIQFSAFSEVSDIMAISSQKNIYIWFVNSGNAPQQLQQLHQANVYYLSIDGTNQVLVSASVDFQLFVWNLKTYQKMIQIDYHKNDSQGSSNFSINNILIDEINKLLFSYNSNRILYIQNYLNQNLIRVNLNQYMVIASFFVLNQSQNVIVISQDSDFSMSIYNYQQDQSGNISFNENKIIPINHSQLPIQLRIINNKIISFEANKLIVTDLLRFEVLYEIDVVNPQINDFIVSLKQNNLIIWSDCSSFCSPKVQIYNFSNGAYIMDTPYYNDIEQGLVLKVILDEDTNTLIIVKYPASVIVQFFNLQSQQASGIIYATNIPLTLPIENVYLIKETNCLVLVAGQQLYAYEIEQRIGDQKQFIPLLRNQQIAQYTDANFNSNFMITDAFSEVWKYNNQTNQLFSITKTLKNTFNTQVKLLSSNNQYLYAILYDCIIQLDFWLNELNTVFNEIDQYIITNNYIFTSNMNGALSQYTLTNLTLTSHTINLDSRVQFMIQIQTTSEILAVSQTNIIYRININTGVSSQWINSNVQILNILYDSAKQIVIIVRKDGNVSFFDSVTWNNSQSKNININSGQVLPQTLSNILQTIIDSQLGLVLIINSISNSINQIQIFSYQFSSGNNPTLTGVSNIGSFSSCSKLPFMNIKITQDSYLIFSGYQINWISRTNNNFQQTKLIRNSDYFTDLLDLIQVNSPVLQNSMFTIEPNALKLFYFVNNTNLNLIYQRYCSFPQLLSYNFSQSQMIQQISIQIIGSCGEELFNDQIYISDPKLELSTIQSCYFDSNTQYQYQFNNVLDQIQFTLNQLNMNPSLLILEQMQQTDFGTNSIGNNMTYLLRFRNQNKQNQILNIYDNYFSSYPYSELQIYGFIINLSNVQGNILFSSQIQEIVMQNITIQFGNNITNSPNVTFNFANMNSVVLQDWVIQGQQVQRNKPFLQFYNISQGLFIDNFLVKDLQISGQIPTLMIIQNVTQVQINNLQFQNVSFQLNSNLQPFIISIQNVINFQLNNSQFVQFQLNQDQILIFQCMGIRSISFSNIFLLSLIKTSLANFSNHFYEGAQELLVNDSEVLMSNITAQDISNLSQSFIYINNTYNSTLLNSSFTNIQGKQCQGTVVQIYKGNTHLIQKALFMQNQGRNGGSVAIFDSLQGFLEINQSIFTQNSASYSGGAIYTSNSVVFILGSQIVNNKAMIGGGLRYEVIKPNIDLPISLRLLQHGSNQIKSIIQDNTAEVYGKNIGSYLYSLNILEQNLTSLNLQQFQTKYQSWAQKLSSSAMNVYLQSNFRSGDVLPLYAQILDEEGNPVFIDSLKVTNNIYDASLIQEIKSFSVKAASFQDNQLKVFGQYTTDFTTYNMTIKAFQINTKVVSNPLSQNILLIQYSTSYASKELIPGEQMYSVIIINFRDCILGEVYQQLDEVFSCFPCPSGQYSLQIPNKQQQTCNQCPNSALNCQLNQINLRQGFWRSDNQSDNILECSRKQENCVPDDLHQYCVQGNYGPLCEQCDVYGEIWEESYQSDGNLSCNSCKKLFKGFYFTRVIIQLLAIFIFLGISVAASLYDSKSIVLAYYLRKLKVICISKSCYLNSASYGLKNLTSFLQTVAVIYEIVFQQFPLGTKSVSQVVGMPLTDLYYSLDCSLSTKSAFPIIYIRILWSFGICLIYFFSISFSLFIYGLSRKQSKRILFYHGAIYTYFFLQSNFTYTLFSMMSCRYIGDSYYILADISYECFTPTHLKFMKIIGIPGIIIWNIIIPAFFYQKMKKCIQQPDSAVSRETYGILYNHYKHKYFYWELVKFYKKLLLNAILVFYIQPIVNKFVFSLLLQILFLILLRKVKPHFLNSHYVIDHLQELILSAKLVIFIYIQNQTELSSQETLLYYEIGISSTFQIFFLLQILKEILKKRYFQIYYMIKRALFQKIPTLKNIFKDTKFENKNNVRHLFLWKRLRIMVKDVLKQEKQEEQPQDNSFERKQKQNRLFQSYRSKLQEIGRQIKESNANLRQSSNDVILNSPTLQQEQQSSEVNMLLKSRISINKQRKNRRSMSVSLINSNGFSQFENDQVKLLMVKQPPEANINLIQDRQSAITIQDKINTPRLLKQSSNLDSEGNANAQFALQKQFKDNRLQHLDSHRQSLMKCESEVNELEVFFPLSPPFKIANTNSNIFKNCIEQSNNYPQLTQQYEICHSENQSPGIPYTLEDIGKSDRGIEHFKDNE